MFVGSVEMVFGSLSLHIAVRACRECGREREAFVGVVLVCFAEECGNIQAQSVTDVSAIF